jgi:hypothetical protein
VSEASGGAEAVGFAGLKVSSNSWAARRSAAGGGTALKQGKMRSLLNRISLEKFDAVYTELLNLRITKQSELAYLTRQIFEKATSQHHFVDMYTQLCIKLNDEFMYVSLEADGGNLPNVTNPNQPSESGLERGNSLNSNRSGKGGNSSPVDRSSMFKAVLLGECQHFFEESMKIPSWDNEPEEER